MAHLWAWFMTAVWPNLLASLIWAGPAFVVHHVRVTRRLDAIHGRMSASPHRCDRAPDDL